MLCIEFLGRTAGEDEMVSMKAVMQEKADSTAKQPPAEYAVVKSVCFERYKRVIAVSDIHADLDGFRGVLKKVQFSGEDALVILGDILGRGEHALELLKEVTALAGQGNVYMVLGNHDDFLQGWLSGRISHEETFDRIKERPTDVLMQMFDEIGVSCDSSEQMESLRQKVFARYPEETTFLLNLPHILDGQFAVFVHGRIKPGDLYTQDFRYCITGDAFGNEPYHYERPVVVGHWPASNYREDVVNANIYYNPASNVYCIDGGNSMKYWDQINYLVFAPDGRVLESGAYDAHPKIKVLEDQEESEDYITILFPNAELEVRETFAQESRCFFPTLNRELMIANSVIYHYKGKSYCTDMTTYALPVKAGDTVSLCHKLDDSILIKKDGIVGIYRGKYQC